MFRSATLRLTLWYLALVMAISLLFSGLLYHVTTGELNSGLKRESQSIYNQFPVFQGDPDINIRPNMYERESSHDILFRLIGFNIIVLVGAGFASYWLARRTLEPIETAHELQKRFTSDVSHELRTPLTAIRMESEVALLNDKVPASELKATLKSNLEEVSKLEGLINNILRLSRLEVDKLEQSFRSVDSKVVFEAASQQVGKRLDDYKLSLKVNNKTNVLGDPESLEQLLVIILDNAIKYSPKKSEITLSAHTSKNQVLWSVEDQGVGISPEALTHVFDRFYRADNSRNKAGYQEGYGLGLSIAKMIADIHSGTITITSKVGQGTKVSVSLTPAPTPASTS